MSAVKALENKLDEYINKYYTNQLIRGLIFTLTLGLSVFLTIILIDYFGEFKTSGRTFLFYALVCIFLGIIGVFILLPLLRRFGIIKRISHDEAAAQIGSHFPKVEDKILNTLQLARTENVVSKAQIELVTASISQRIKQLKPISFSTAVNYKENTRYLKFLAIPLLCIALLYAVNKDILTQSTNRLMNYDDTQLDEEALPYDFLITNKNLQVLEQDDFTVEVEIKENKYAPSEIFVEIEGTLHKLKKVNKKLFTYTFRNVQKETKFRIKTSEVSSAEQQLKVIPKPSLLGFEIQLDYPAHTQLQDEVLKNIGDLIIPEGTRLTWVFNTKNTSEFNLRIADTLVKVDSDYSNVFKKSLQVYEPLEYDISVSNEYAQGMDSIQYYVSVTKDNIPSIQVEEKPDSVQKMIRYFNGDVSDDYGFSKLVFQYTIYTKDGKQKEKKSEPLAVSKAYNKDNFFHFLDISKFQLAPGESIEYYFTIWDNDGINGPKSARSSTKKYNAPTLEELADQSDEASNEIKDDLQKNIDEANELRKELKDLKESLLQKEQPDWQDKNKLEKFLEKQQNFQNQIEQLQQKNEEMQKQNNQFNQQSEEILKKQEMLNKLFDELMSDEMKKMYEELQKMMNELNKDQLLNKMDEIEMSQDEINKELDRALEQFKQFEYDQKLEQITDQLEELAEKQEQLAEDTKNKEKSNFDLNKEQEKIDEAFKDVQQEIDELEKLNEELENKNEVPETAADEQEIEQSIEESKENLGEKKNKKASESQKNAAEKMQQMAQKMEAAQAEQQAEKMQEDMDALRQLLENLIDYSFNQEEVMEAFKNLNTRDPKYVELGQQQSKLKDDAKLIEDSLYALSKRILQLSPYINKEVSAMNQNIEESLKNITERKTSKARANQQYVMTSVNNLALLFDEAMKQMQQAMQNSQPGSGSCNNPGGTGSSKGGKPQSMEQLKKQMEQQMKKMQEALNKGESPGGKEDGKKGDNGKKPGEGKGGQGGMPGQGAPSSKQLAQMAAEQSALRQKIQELSKQLNEDGSGAGNGLKEIAKDMEEIEEDIINGEFNQEMFNRQQDIMTRLLEHEKAQREREWDDKRKSNEAKEQEYSNPMPYLEYKKKKEKELELLKTIPPSLKPYYKNKVNEYFEQLD